MEVEMEMKHARCAGFDVRKDTVVACARVHVEGEVRQEVRTFDTTTKGLLVARSSTPSSPARPIPSVSST